MIFLAHSDRTLPCDFHCYNDSVIETLGFPQMSVEVYNLQEILN